jgi:hypothetical protein
MLADKWTRPQSLHSIQTVLTAAVSAFGVSTQAHQVKSQSSNSLETHRT